MITIYGCRTSQSIQSRGLPIPFAHLSAGLVYVVVRPLMKGASVQRRRTSPYNVRVQRLTCANAAESAGRTRPYNVCVQTLAYKPRVQAR